jgi:S1-C subfamily serine protease
MFTKLTIAWRLAVLGLLVVTVPLSLHHYDMAQKVDTETMLDVSVSIKTISHVRIDSVGDTVWKSGAGSGFLISSTNCEVLTNHHVVQDAAHVEVFPRKWPNATGIPATVINSNPRADVAILRMTNCDNLPEARLGDSDNVSSGDEVYAVGNPLGKNPDSISRGIVSHTERFNDAGLPYLQTDANINQGNSGGALFNRSGEVIGINTAILATASGQKFGIAFALPINIAKRETRRLRNGSPSWGEAGMENLATNLTPDEAALFNVPNGLGAIIMTEDPSEGPGAGKLFAKDLIYMIGDTSVSDVEVAKRIINSHDPGDTVRLGIIRKGDFVDVDIELVDGWRAMDTPTADHYEGYLGLTLEMWGEDSNAGKFDSPVITQVKSLGPSHMAYISSSQKTLINAGRMIYPVQLDVKTVTGVVASGEYYPIDSIDQLEEYAHAAYKTDAPLLIEIEVWARKMPMKMSEPLEKQRVSFHKVMPKLTSVLLPEMLDRANSIASNL